MSSKLSNKKSVGSSTKSASHIRFNTDSPNAIDIALKTEKEEKNKNESVLNDAGQSIVFEEVSISDIIPRSINNYKQGQIEKLAKSIKATNNRLINPITIARIEDFPADGEVMQKYRELGTDLTPFKYVIVSGERRFRAWQYLRDQEQKTSGLNVTKFDSITANILTKAEMKKEKSYYNDSNLQSRHISPLEILYNIRNVFMDLNTPEKKRLALIEMNNGSEDGIDSQPEIAAKKFVRAKYVKYYLEEYFGIVDWSDSTIKINLWVIDSLAPEVIQAILEEKYNTKQGKLIAKADFDTQREILGYWLSDDKESYKNAVAELAKEDTEHSSRGVSFGKTKKDITMELKAARKGAERERKKIENMLSSVSPQNSKAIKDALKSFDRLIGDINIILDGMK